MYIRGFVDTLLALDYIVGNRRRTGAEDRSSYLVRDVGYNATSHRDRACKFCRVASERLKYE